MTLNLALTLTLTLTNAIGLQALVFSMEASLRELTRDISVMKQREEESVKAENSIRQVVSTSSVLAQY